MRNEKWKLFTNKCEETPKNSTKCSTGVINAQLTSWLYVLTISKTLAMSLDHK